MATHCHHPLRPNCWRRRPSLWAPSQRSVAGRSVALEVHLAVRALQAAVETPKCGCRFAGGIFGCGGIEGGLRGRGGDAGGQGGIAGRCSLHRCKVGYCCLALRDEIEHWTGSGIKEHKVRLCGLLEHRRSICAARCYHFLLSSGRNSYSRGLSSCALFVASSRVGWRWVHPDTTYQAPKYACNRAGGCDDGDELRAVGAPARSHAAPATASCRS